MPATEGSIGGEMTGSRSVRDERSASADEWLAQAVRWGGTRAADSLRRRPGWWCFCWKAALSGDRRRLTSEIRRMGDSDGRKGARTRSTAVRRGATDYLRVAQAKEGTAGTRRSATMEDDDLEGSHPQGNGGRVQGAAHRQGRASPVRSPVTKREVWVTVHGHDAGQLGNRILRDAGVE